MTPLGRVLGFLLLFGLGSGTLAFQQKYPDWPLTPVVPAPMPQPASPVSSLKAEELYVVQSDDEVQLLASPVGILAVQEEAGPIVVRGKFVDGPAVETRRYEKKRVFLVTRVAAGGAELLLVPRGVVVRRSVGGDDGPVPPPKPVDPPQPPDPKPPVPAKTFRVVFVHESGKPMSSGQVGVVYGRAVQEYLDKTCTATDGGRGWRIRDPNTIPDKGTMGEMFKAGLSKMKVTDPPCVFVEKNDHIEIIPIEEKPEAMIAKFNEYVTGKK